jgi:hypothetical protein
MSLLKLAQKVIFTKAKKNQDVPTAAANMVITIIPAAIVKGVLLADFN